MRVGAAACPARSNFIRQTGEALAFPWRGRCHGLRSVTDEVEGCSVVPTYGDDWQLRPHPSALAGCQLPLQEKPSLRSTGAVAQKKALSFLQRVAPKGPGVEGTRCVFLTARKDETPHIRHAKRRDTFAPGRRLFLRNHWPLLLTIGHSPSHEQARASPLL